MYSDETIRERIWLIAEGIPLKLDNMTIRTTDSGKLIVTGWIIAINFRNISKENVLEELDDLKTSFGTLLKEFPELNDVVRGNTLTIEYHIAYGDDGKAGIGLCSEIEGNINWYTEPIDQQTSANN